MEDDCTPSKAAREQDRQYRQNLRVTGREVGDELFLANPGSESLYHLNVTGAALWRLLAEPTSVKEAVQVLREAFPNVAKGELEVGEEFVHESIIGSLFRGRVEETTSVGNYAGIIPSIEGWARITGFNTIVIDERDPYAHGFEVV